MINKSYSCARDNCYQNGEPIRYEGEAPNFCPACGTNELSERTTRKTPGVAKGLSGILVLLATTVPTATTAFLLGNPNDRQRPVIKQGSNFGYDFDGDGKLDSARTFVREGKLGIESMNLKRDSTEFKELQREYSLRH